MKLSYSKFKLTEEKIAQFMEWILSKTDNGKLLAKPNEIVRAACEISDRLDETQG